MILLPPLQTERAPQYPFYFNGFLGLGLGVGGEEFFWVWVWGVWGVWVWIVVVGNPRVLVVREVGTREGEDSLEWIWVGLSRGEWGKEVLGSDGVKLFFGMDGG